MGASSITTVPPWCSVIAFTIDRPEAETAGVAGAPVVESGEALEHQLAVLGPDAGSVVVDGELDDVVVGRSPTATRRARRDGPRCRAGCGRRAAAGRGDRARVRPTRDRCRRGRVAAARCRRAPARRGRPRATSSIGAGPSASSSRARSSSSLTVSSMRTSSASARCATSGQSARSGLCSATSRLVRIDASGLRSSCDASDTNCRCFCDDVSSRVEHRVHRARETADLVVGGGLGNATVHGPAGDRLGLEADRLDRPQRAAGEVPRGQRHQQDHRGHDDQEDVGDRVDRAVHRRRRLLRDERDVAGLRVDLSLRFLDVASIGRCGGSSRPDVRRRCTQQTCCDFGSSCAARRLRAAR